MRFPIVTLAASSCVHAAWLRWSVDREAVWAPQETGHITENSQTGWTPIPTPAPGAQNDGEAVLDLLKRQTSEKDWTNSKTCGWFSGISSSAVQCGEGLTCATNSNHAVACASGTIGAFYTACLDYSAFQAGSCSDLNPATGCCQNAAAPECGTYIWTGSPSRSMYQCFKTASVVSILDVPQFVLDASLFSKTHTTPKPTTTSVASSATTDDSASSSPGKTGGNGSSSGGTDGADGTDGTGGADGAGNAGGTGDATTAPGSNSSNNTPVIVGSVVGGIAGLLALLILLLFLRRKVKGKLGLGFTRNKNNKTEDHSNKAHHTTNVAAAPAQAPKTKFGLCFGRNKKNKEYNSSKAYDMVAKGRNSSGSETTTAVPMPVQLPPQQHYHNQQHHYHQQAQTQPLFQPQPQVQPQQLHLQQQQPQRLQYGVPVPSQQPSVMSYTINETPGHVSQPSYSQNTSYTSNPPVPSSSGAAPHFIVGGIVPGPNQSSENQQRQQPQMQPYFPQQQQPQSHPQFQFLQQQLQQQQQQQQQQGIPTQSQPVNHIHVYYAPPAQQGEPAISNTSSQFPSATPDPQNRGSAAATPAPMPDALGLFVQQHPDPSRSGTPNQSGSQATQTQTPTSRDEDHDDIPAYYGHSRGMSANDRPSSPDADAAWLATRGPAYRQSM